MKMSPEFSKAQQNMQPGVITSDGFLGEDHRNIIEVIEADEEQFAALGIDIDEAGDRLRFLMEEGRKGLGEPITVDDKWVVTVYEARGHLASPFEDGIFRKVNALIKIAGESDGSETSILVSDLSLHLLKRYHFLQGKGSSFRLEPAQIRKVLGY